MRMNLSLGLPGGGAGVASDPLAAYAANGFTPDLVLDFENGVFAYDGVVRASVSDVVTHTRASTATRTNSSGNLETVSSGTLRSGHHLYLSGSWTRAGVLVEESRTNSIAVSRDVGGTGWVASNSPTVATDETGIFGDANAAQTIEDANATDYAFLTYAVTVPNDGNPSVASCHFKKTLGATNRPGLQIQYAGGTSVRYAVAVNTNDGTLTARTGTGISAPTWMKVEDRGDKWRVSVAGPNNSTGNTTLNYVILPAVAASDTATWDPTATGSCVVDGHQLEVGHTEPTSFILTSGSTATRAADVLTVDPAKIPSLSAGGSYSIDCYVTERFNSNSPRLAGIFIDGSNRTSLTTRVDGGVGAALVISGSVQFNAGTGAGTYAQGINVNVKAAFRYASNTANLAVAGSAGTEATSVSVSDLSSGTIYFAEYGGGGDQFKIASMTIKKFLLWPVNIGDTGIEEATA